ncbi:hypothetical protein N0V85_003956 [Neurospora sp. IMI 360204]|nr:hypothetical protein N0V85_003956 [Neurospora sp. IMI 360204]
MQALNRESLLLYSLIEGSYCTASNESEDKRKRDEYEEESESFYDADEEDESLGQPEPCLTSSPFDTDDEYDGPTFQEWCAYERAKKRNKNTREIRHLFHFQSKVVIAADAAAPEPGKVYTDDEARVLNGIASVKFFNWLGEKDRDLWDSVTDNWGVDRSGRLFKLKEQRCYILYQGEDEGKDDNFVRAFQIAYDEIRAKEQVIGLTSKLLEEILSLHSLPVFDNFKWISFIALCRRVKSLGPSPGLLTTHQLQDLAT